MRHITSAILAGTAIALVLAVPVFATPILPSATDVSTRTPDPARQPAPPIRTRTSNTFGPPDATTRARVPSPPPAVYSHQPSARIISTPNVPAATNEPAAAPSFHPAPVSAPAPVPAPSMHPQGIAPAPRASVPQPVPVQTAPAREPAMAAPAVSEPVKAVSAPPSFAAADSAVAEKIRELIAKKYLERLVPRKNERDIIEAAYLKNRSMPLWLTMGAPSEKARAAMAHLRTVDADGLEPADYPLELSASSVEGLAEADLKFTLALVAYARHALNGRVHFSRVSPSIEYKESFDAADVMQKLTSSTDLKRTLDGFNPQHPEYKALKAKYAEMRMQSFAAPVARIANGTVLKYGKDKTGREFVMSDARVPELRDRLGLPPAADNRYDRALADAVARFQKANGITVTGQLTAATVEALNGPSREKQMAAMRATLERWRWMPRNMGATHVALNIPDFHLRVMHNGAQVWKTRVVVGKPSQATPLLTETMKFITVNPTWNVPQSIIYNELLPLYESTDPQIFARMGLSVERKPNGEVRVFQPPGERNALGRIRFNFPNKFLVYQHDTPEKHYFAHDKRAYSHGCMRVQDPMKYAEVLLTYAAPRGNHTKQSVERMIGGDERQIDFAQHIPVHISYQTAFVDDAGKLQFRDDVYGLDQKVMELLTGHERAVADVSIERPVDPNFKPTAQHIQRMQSATRGGSPFALFEQLFR
jgi:murein L,D-transpeptidase YcbB/YkuD